MFSVFFVNKLHKLHKLFVPFVSFDDNLVAHPGARTWCHAVPWWALCCSLSSRTAAASKQKYLDYDMCSRRWICAMMILFYAVYNRGPGVYMVCLGALFSVCYNVFANGLWAGRVLPAFILDKVGKIFRVRSTYIGL